MDQIKNLITLKQASKISGYHADYISSLIRTGKIRGKKIGRNWFTTEDEVEKYLSSKKFVPATRLIRSKVTPLKIFMAIAFAVVVLIGAGVYSSSQPTIIKLDRESEMIASPLEVEQAAAQTVFMTQ